MIAVAILAMLAIQACVSYPPTEATPRSGAPSADDLSAAFEPLFVAEFAETESARAAWRAFGGRILARYQDRLYPPVPIETFNARAIERLRAFRSARPEATLEELSYAVLDGLYPADRLDEKYLHALIIWEAGSSKIEMISFHDAARPADRVPETTGRPELVSQSGVTMLAVPRLGKGDSAIVTTLLRDHSGPLVLDLRGNGGGVVFEVVLMASLFVPPQSPLFTLQTVSGGKLLRSRPSSTDLGDIGAILVIVDEKTDMGRSCWPRPWPIRGVQGSRAPSPGIRAETSRSFGHGRDAMKVAIAHAPSESRRCKRYESTGRRSSTGSWSIIPSIPTILRLSRARSPVGGTTRRHGSIDNRGLTFTAHAASGFRDTQGSVYPTDISGNVVRSSR